MPCSCVTTARQTDHCARARSTISGDRAPSFRRPMRNDPGRTGECGDAEMEA